MVITAITNNVYETKEKHMRDTLEILILYQTKLTKPDN